MVFDVIISNRAQEHAEVFVKYLWIYQVNNGRVEVKGMYHQLQDYENIFKTDGV